MHVKLAESLDECTNNQKSLKENLRYQYIYALRTVRMLESGIDGTRKISVWSLMTGT